MPLPRHPEKTFATPDQSVLTISGTVPGKHQNVFFTRKLAVNGRRVGVVMKNLEAFFSAGICASPRPLARGVLGVHVANQTVGLDIVDAPEIFDHLSEHIHAARALQVSDVRRHHHPIAPGQGNSVFHVTTGCEQPHRQCLGKL